MLPKFALMLAILACGVGAKGSSLRGLILADRLGGSPVPRVRVSAPGANPTETGESGSFTLQFPNAQPGDVVQVTVDKPGYVVVNYVQLRVVLPRNPDAEELTLLICKEEQFEEWARQLYRLKSLEAIEQAYGSRIKLLEESNQKTSEAMAKLRRELEESKVAAEKAADELARLRPGETSDLYSEAMSLFLEGKVNDALQTLNEEKLQRSIAAAKVARTEAEKEIAEALQGYLLKAKLLATQFRFADAERVYEAATQAAPESAVAHFELARFNQDLRHFSVARSEYQRALEIMRRNGDQLNVARALDNLGALDREQNRSSEARQHVEEALAIWRQLATQNLAAYSFGVARTLHLLAMVDADQNRFVEARQHSEDALRILNLLSQQNSNDSLDDARATTLNNLGDLDEYEKRLPQARQHFEEALNIYRRLAQIDPSYYLARVAAALGNLGILDSTQNRIPEDRQLLGEALEIFRELSERNQDSFLPDLAKTLCNLGAVEALQGQATEARSHLEEALQILRRLGDEERGAGLAYLSMTLNDLGVLDKKQNRRPEARQHYEEAVKIRRNLAQQNPDVYQPLLAESLVNLGNLDDVDGQAEMAKTDYREAIDIYSGLAKHDPNRYTDIIARLNSYIAALSPNPTNK